jgi:hypothetical protein
MDDDQVDKTYGISFQSDTEEFKTPTFIFISLWPPSLTITEQVIQNCKNSG